MHKQGISLAVGLGLQRHILIKTNLVGSTLVHAPKECDS